MPFRGRPQGIGASRKSGKAPSLVVYKNLMRRKAPAVLTKVPNGHSIRERNLSSRLYTVSASNLSTISPLRS